MAEEKIAIGVCKEISEKGDWTTFEIDAGTKYPIRLTTKKAAIIEVGRTASRNGTEMAWHYTESESDRINERSGKPYVNRYLEKVEPSSGPGASPETVAAVAAHANEKAVDWDAKERRDYRSRTWAQTISAFAHTIDKDESVEDVFLRLQAFQRKLYVDITGTFAYPADESDVPFS